MLLTHDYGNQVRPTVSFTRMSYNRSIPLVNLIDERVSYGEFQKNVVGKNGNFRQDRDSPGLPDGVSIPPSRSGGKIN